MIIKEAKGTDMLPHRNPFLFLDRVMVGEDDIAVGEVTFGEDRDFFRGHFPSCPIVPGVVLLEAMAQAAAAGALLRRSGGNGLDVSEVMLFAGAEKVRFHRPVRPGDRLVTRAETLRCSRALGKFRVRGYVNGEPAAEAELLCVARRLAKCE